MNNEEIAILSLEERRNLLIRDLCGRLPYNPEINIFYSYNGEDCIRTINLDKTTIGYLWDDEKRVVPVLRKYSSMTDEEVEELNLIEPDAICYGNEGVVCDIRICDDMFEHGVKLEKFDKVVDFLNKHHFDWRGLIEHGLAVEAEVEMIDFVLDNKVNGDSTISGICTLRRLCRPEYWKFDKKYNFSVDSTTKKFVVSTDKENTNAYLDREQFDFYFKEEI